MRNDKTAQIFIKPQLGMFSSGKSPSLQTELSKLAKLSNVQGGLPPLMRGLPALAILAGEVVAKATNGQNIIEERIIGADEVFTLQAPGPQTPTTRHVWVRPGVEMMCQTCGQDATGRYHTGSIMASPGPNLRRNERTNLINPRILPTFATYSQGRSHLD